MADKESGKCKVECLRKILVCAMFRISEMQVAAVMDDWDQEQKTEFSYEEMCRAVGAEENERRVDELGSA